eukprot:TRINITY_DN6783_c0_g1_i1.p1 TRINITY_DN6783_c0_g1~~TRINITY_DN6783_c0_g1_i1.p1  ORF type:complete len:262 (-),score=59.25 TRINITY_DN6783_c0_g1_i1:211-996(-)
MGKFTKDKRDVYYRKAKEDGFRARSAYKLLQIDEEYDIFRNVQRAIDICAAPGSWSQILSRKLTQKGLNFNDEVRIVSVDIQEMAPIDNVVEIQGDITKQDTVDKILQAFKGNRSEIVVCDGAPDVTGFHDIDQYVQSQLLVAALNIATHVLKTDGTFIAKIFKGNDVKFLYSQFKVFFGSVDIMKPKSSRASSVEYFIVCRFYDPPAFFKPKNLSTFINEPTALEVENKTELITEKKEVTDEDRMTQFVTCGDLSGFDEP